MIFKIEVESSVLTQICDEARKAGAVVATTIELIKLDARGNINCVETHYTIDGVLVGERWRIGDEATTYILLPVRIASEKWEVPAESQS